MRCLGLDIGSSRIKGAVLDLETNTVGSVGDDTMLGLLEMARDSVPSP